MLSVPDVATVNFSMFVRSVVLMNVSLASVLYSSCKLMCLIVVYLVIAASHGPLTAPSTETLNL